MKYILLFIVCYFTNLMEVYHIQGCLKEQRTQKWWEDGLNKLHGCTNIREKNPAAWKYEKNSWIPCLIAHAFDRPDTRHTRRNRHGRKSTAIPKRIRTDARHIYWDRYRRHAITI